VDVSERRVPLDGFMTKRHQVDKDEKDENGEPLNLFGEMLRVMDVEHLIRIRHRLKKIGRKRMVEILTDEIEEREAIEKQEAEERVKAMAKKAK
jgi:hypothetical protein